LDFFSCVKPLDFGDDSLMAVKPGVLPYFNNIIFRDLSVVNFNMEYTCAAKDGSMQSSMKINEVSFLKRNFKYVAEFKRFVPQIDYNSIIKCLIWYIPSKSVNTETQMASSFVSAQLELFLILNKEDFENVCSQLEEIFSMWFYQGKEKWKFPKTREELIIDVGY